ncbi:MAG: hypothetical protein WAT79_11595 [Saprospiraceae bacterium]
MQKILTLVFIVLLINSSYSQTGGISIQTGLTYGFSKEKVLTQQGQGHYGWMVGADARLMGGDMYFLVGGQYHRTSIYSTDSPKFFETDMDIVMTRVGLGFTIVKFGYKSFLRSKILGSINFVIDGPDTKTAFPNSATPANLNDSFLGATTGIGWTKGILDIDFDFQYGLLNSVFKQPDSKFSYFTLMCGVNF